MLLETKGVIMASLTLATTMAWKDVLTNMSHEIIHSTVEKDEAGNGSGTDEGAGTSLPKATIRKYRSDLYAAITMTIIFAIIISMVSYAGFNEGSTHKNAGG